MLAWPSFALLRKALPNARIHALVPTYTQPMAEICPFIDKVIIDPGQDTGLKGVFKLATTFRRQRYDAAIALFSTTRVGAAVAAAAIDYRLAPATKLAQLFFNKRELQRRSLSSKPEWRYNCDLIYRFLRDHHIACPPEPEPPYLRFPQEDVVSTRKSFIERHGIDDTSILVFIHPGSGGSANNLTVRQYAELARSLSSTYPLTFVVCAGPGEAALAQTLTRLLSEQRLSAHTFHSDSGLVDFARHLSIAHLFISGSTGPLHIAGALNLKTVGFYPRKRSSTLLRWQTINEDSRRLAFCPPEGAEETDMSSIDVIAAATLINHRLLGDPKDNSS
ncbi:MAG: glycosyltransferase family 9 protein [Gammaproteobacteria bacterium]